MLRRVLPLRRRVYQLAVLVVALELGLAVQAVAQATSGVISGTIADAQSGVLPGVTLIVRNADTGLTRTIVTEADGRYRVSALPPGRYDLKAELEGFAPVEVKDLTLTIGLEMRRDLTMTLKGVQESVVVTGLAPIVETTRTEVASVVTQQQIESLPIADRQPVMLALLLPGTGTDGTRPRRANANVGSGSTFYSNEFLVDGAFNTAAKSGEPRMDFPQAAIREFKVNVSQSNAEFGGHTGGVISIATKGGTNRWSGEAFEFFRDKRLNTLNRFEQELGSAKPEYRRNSFGVSLGGPVIRDRAHFFVATERTNEQTFFTVNTGRPEFYSAFEGTFANPTTSTMFFGRGDVQMTQAQHLFARYGYTVTNQYCESCGGPNAAFSGQGTRSPADSLVVGHTWVLSSRAVNEIMFQGPSRLWSNFSPPGVPYWTKLGEFPAERFAPLTSVYQFPSLTWGSNLTSVRVSKYYQFREDLSITAGGTGSHNLKSGIALLNIPIDEEAGGIGQPTWTFSTDQPFNPNDPASLANLRNANLFTASFPVLRQQYSDERFQAYVQDEWKARPDLTLNFGLRYDLQYKGFNQDLDVSVFPRRIPFIDPASRGDKDNFGPRFGIVYDLKGDGKSVVRGGYGLYYQYVRQTVVSSEPQNLLINSISIRNPSYPDAYQGKDPLSFASTAPPNINIVDNSIRDPKAHTVNVGLSRELGSTLAIHVDGVYSRTLDMETVVQINTQSPVTGLRPLPEWGRIDSRLNVGEAKYRALFVRLDKRFAKRHQYLLSYTLSKQDDFGGGGTQASVPSQTDFYNPSLDWGPSSNDRRHAFVASGSVMLPYSVTLGAVWTLRSSMPFSAIAGTDLNRDTRNTDYVPGTTKNQGNRNLDLGLVNAWRAQNRLGPIAESQIDTNPFNQVNLRVSKAFVLGANRRVELIGQVFNALGTDNLLTKGGSWVTNALSNSFGRILSAENRQQGELAVRFVW